MGQTINGRYLYGDELAGYNLNLIKGKTIEKIEGCEVGNDEIIFSFTDGTKFKMYHDQDCCESVSLEDINGDINHLIGQPLIVAEERSNSDGQPVEEWDESFTWTFYTFATNRGYVTLRWYGTSNGYYSESVDFEQIFN